MNGSKNPDQKPFQPVRGILRQAQQQSESKFQSQVQACPLQMHQQLCLHCWPSLPHSFGLPSSSASSVTSHLLSKPNRQTNAGQSSNPSGMLDRLGRLLIFHPPFFALPEFCYCFLPVQGNRCFKEQRKKHALKYSPLLKDSSTQAEFSMNVSLKNFNKKKTLFFLRQDLYLQENKICPLGWEKGEKKCSEPVQPQRNNAVVLKLPILLKSASQK